MRTRTLVIALLFVAPSVAAEPKEVQLGASAGYSLLVGSRSMSGYGVSVRAALGITWSLALTLEAHYSAHPLSPRNGQMVFTTAGAEWALDVLRFVPFVRLEGGAYFSQDPALGATTSAGLGLSLGTDYRATRAFSLGIYGRYHLLATDLNKYPAYVDTGVRFTFHID